MTGEPIDLIRLEGEGNSVILRISGTQQVGNYQVTDDDGPAGPDVLVGEFLVDTAFVRGSLRTAVFLEDPDHHPRIVRRIELTAAEVDRAGAFAERVKARGDSRLERVLSHALLGDLVSVYVAVLEGVDPTPVDAIQRLKLDLA